MPQAPPTHWVCDPAWGEKTRAGNSYHNNSPKITQKKQNTKQNIRKNKIGPSSIHPLSLSHVQPSTSERGKKSKKFVQGTPDITTRQKITQKSKLDQVPLIRRVWATFDLPLPKRSPDKQTNPPTNRELRIII